LKIIAAVVLFITASINIFAQSDNIPVQLLNEYFSVKKSENSQRKTELALEMEKYMNTTVLKENEPNVNTESGRNNSNVINDWYSTDVIAYSGNISEHTKKPLVIKQGEDGLLYLLVALKPVFSQKGVFRVYKSSDGGVNWSQIVEYPHYTEYYLSMDMLVESRSNSIADSTRIFVYVTSSTETNGNNAKLNMYSIRRDGTAPYSGIVAFPSAGRKFEQVTLCSDGQYYQNSTYLHAFVKESPNAGPTIGFRHFRTVNWGQTHTSELITTDTVDNYPGAQFLATSSNDSIYISFERVFDIYSTGFGIYRTPELPSAYRNYVLTPLLENGVKNEKPCLTISQQNPAVEKNMIITFTSRNNPYSYYSTNSGRLWTFKVFSLTRTCAFTFCSSDSSSFAGNNFVMGFVNLNGDSIVSTRLSASAFVNLTKINNIQSSPGYVPAFGIYTSETGKSSITAFAGSGGANAYFDGEHMITGIQTISNEIPSGFSLEQNYPNPFNPVTNIRFSIPKSGAVTLKVFDVSGKEVAQLINENMDPGSYNFDFNASHLSSGVYFYRINAEGFADVKKMILVK
jgi:hypothetical protein